MTDPNRVRSMKKYNKIIERIRWWTHHPREELIYLLGGTPNSHQNILHYRNIESVFANLEKKINSLTE
jgi:hypothetical protein